MKTKCYHRRVTRKMPTYKWECLDCGLLITQEEKLEAWGQEDCERCKYGCLWAGMNNSGCPCKCHSKSKLIIPRYTKLLPLKKRIKKTVI